MQTNMKLTADQKNMLSGGDGKTIALAMHTLVRYGEAFGADKLVPIASAHLAGSFGISKFGAYYEILERFAADNVKVRVKTTVNPRPGHKQNILTKLALGKQERLERGLDAVGVTPNFSCVCYAGANVPKFGDYLGWAESSAVQYANSVIGARVNRNSLVIDLCAAVTGYIPEFGYMLDENRRGQVHVKLDVDKMDASGLGFILGKRLVNRVPVIEHYDFTLAELKNMGGSMAASGAVAIFHVEGVTPEAPDLKTAFGGAPQETITITQKDLDSLRTKSTADAGMVVFGCPQLTMDEAVALSQFFSGKKVSKRTWFCMIPDDMKKFESTKEYQAVRSAGVEVVSWCPLAALSVYIGPKPILTMSGKLYYYLSGTEYGTQDDCLKACGVSK